jgi:hypothetical protein
LKKRIGFTAVKMARAAKAHWRRANHRRKLKNKTLKSLQAGLPSHAQLEKKRRKLDNFIAKKHWVEIERLGKRYKVLASGSWPVPEILCLEQNYSETVEFLNLLRVLLDDFLKRNVGFAEKKGGKQIHRYYDYSNVKLISPAVAMMIAAEYDRALFIRPEWKLHVYDIRKWDSSVKSALTDLGFFDLLGIALNAEQDNEIGRMRMTRFNQATNVEAQEAHVLIFELAKLLNLTEEFSAPDLNAYLGRLRLFEALVEATENTTVHAYPDSSPTDNITCKRRWMTGAVTSSEGKLTVISYDQGVSIPASLPNSVHWKTLIQKPFVKLFGGDKDALNSQRDPHLLHLAMSRPTSSTRRPGRGKGLPLLKGVVSAVGRGKLKINSRHAEYVLETGKKPTARYCEIPVKGTLIEWNLWSEDWKSK